MMRWIAKKAGQALWGMTSPIRRPLQARLDARVERLVGNTVNARMLPALLEAMSATDRRLERIEAALGSASYAASAIAEEMDLVLGGISREVFRLQAQVEELRSVVLADGREPGSAFSLVAEAGDDEPDCHPMSQERAMVG